MIAVQGSLIGGRSFRFYERPVSRLAIGFVLAIGVSLVAGPSSVGQEPIAGLRPVVPTIPPVKSRLLEGDGQFEQLVTDAPEQPTASFVESIRANDAAFQVIVGQGRLLTLKRAIAEEQQETQQQPVISIGDPTVIEFEIINNRTLRILGLRPGITDLSISNSAGENYTLQVHATYDLKLLEAQLRQLFPSAFLRLAQLRDHIVVEGQARQPKQVKQIVNTIEAFLVSAETSRQLSSSGTSSGNRLRDTRSNDQFGDTESTPQPPGSEGIYDERPNVSATATNGRVINLIRVPGAQQVLLKVRIAELNRTATREIGADILAVDPDTGSIVGTQIGGASVSASAIAGLNGLIGEAISSLGSSSTAFGIFPSDDFAIIFRALRENGLVRILAEPNLIALSGHRANFLAGGEFPIPVPQTSGGVANSVTVDFREFGVRLEFLPTVLNDERVRLSVTPEVSTIDFSLGTTLVVGGDPVPGLNTRRASTTVELKEGQTLGMAGLLQVEVDGRTQRIPGLGDLPILGPLFANTQNKRTEKELLVLVTPYLIDSLDECEIPPPPGASIEEPTDLEHYFKNRIEGNKGRNHRSTIQYEPFAPRRIILYDQTHISGPVGFGN